MTFSKLPQHNKCTQHILRLWKMAFNSNLSYLFHFNRDVVAVVEEFHFQ